MNLFNSCYYRASNSLRNHNISCVLDDFGTLYTDAFWMLQYELYNNYMDYDLWDKVNDYVEEIVACLLGGFGFKAEIGWAAFERLKSRGLIRRGVELEKVVRALSEPLLVRGVWTRYRFPMQKARYVCGFLSRNDLDSAPLEDDLAFRSWLLNIHGIGPKTASWITRNLFQSDNVAIVDIHLYRAGLLTGFISPEMNIDKDYFEIEKCFLNYCHLLDVKPSVMDYVMWYNMKNTNKIAISLIKKKKQNGRV